MNTKATIIGGRFKLGKKIGSGAFGSIYKGTDVVKKERVAIKLEREDAKHPLLAYEYKLYNMFQGQKGIPQVKWHGQSGKYNVLILELLGPTLEDLFTHCQRSFSLKTILLLADQMLTRIQYMHERNFIHRDLKPDNLLMGAGHKHRTLYLIDFGLAKQYRHDQTLKHIKYREDRSFIGTARYASLNAHTNVELSRRDDLESIGFILVYLFKGKLPWQGLNVPKGSSHNTEIMLTKMNTPFKTMCQGLPLAFQDYFSYCRQLKFTDTPDYEHLRQLFQDVYRNQGYHREPAVFDWELKK